MCLRVGLPQAIPTVTVTRTKEEGPTGPRAPIIRRRKSRLDGREGRNEGLQKKQSRQRKEKRPTIIATVMVEKRAITITDAGEMSLQRKSRSSRIYSKQLLLINTGVISLVITAYTP
jgi:hypothetical protein